MNLFDLFESNRKDVDEGYTVVPSINRERYTDLSHEGLEGPFRLKSGKVVYYDPKVGKYYDRDSDMYMSHDDYAAHENDDRMEEGKAADILKAQIPMTKQIEADLAAYGYVKGTPEYKHAYDVELDYYRKFGFQPNSDHELDEKSNKLGFKLSPTLVNRRQAHALTTGFKKNKFNFEEYEAESLDDELAKYRSSKATTGRSQNPFASAEPAGELSQRPGRAQNPFASAKPERVREIPRIPQISSAEEQRRTSQLNRCKQLLDIVNASKNPNPDLMRIGNYIDKIDVNRFNPGELDNIEKYLSNYVAGAVAKKSRKASKHGRVTVTRIDPADVMAETIGPDMDDPYEQGWYAHWSDANPYQKGTPEHASWAAGQAERESQSNHYDEDVTEKAEPVKFSAKYPGKPKGKDYYDYRADVFEPGDPDDIEIDRYSDEPVHNFLARTQRSTRAPRFDQDYNTFHEGKTGPGLWANIHKKQERIKHGSGERMRKPGSKGAPTNANLKAAKTESVAEDAKFGGYYKGTQKGAPRPGQGFGSMEESISLNTTVKSIANDIGEPITSLYATLKKMAKQYYDNNGDLKRFGLVAAGVGSRWFQQYYVNKMQADLYDLTRQSPTHAAELKQFLRGKMIKDNLVMPKSFSDLNKELPEILARMGSKMGADALKNNAKRWVHNKQDYEDFINKLVNGKGGDDDGDGYGSPATVDTPSKDALLGKQRNHAEEIVNDVLRKLSSSVAGDIRNAIARAPNKLQALQQELQRRKIAPPIEESNKWKIIQKSERDKQGRTPLRTLRELCDELNINMAKVKSCAGRTQDFPKPVDSLATTKRYYRPKEFMAWVDTHNIKERFGNQEIGEGIAGNMKVRSDPLTNLKQHKDIKMKTPDPFKGMASHNNLASAKARNLVAKGAQTAGPGTGSHKNKALDVKKGLTRNLKHKGKIDFSESSNFLTWAVSSGYNVITNPAVYENAKRVYNRLLTESKGDLKPGQYYVWQVNFDDGGSSRIKIKDEKFDVKAYYAKKNKVVVNIDYNWEPHNG